MRKTKVIAMYLPQYHRIPENDEFWGEGFTDWISVKNAKALFEGHNQPKVPLDNNYYDLSYKETILWQAKIAKEYGVYGFGIYHYWFNSEKNLLTKPAQIILENNDVDINFFYAWDNISWKRSWSNIKEEGNAWAPAVEERLNLKQGPKTLIPYVIGNEADWEKHYNYLLPFFKDSRYIKIEGCPLFVIFHRDDVIVQMCEYWNDLAKRDGFNGIHFIFRFDDNCNSLLNNFFFKYEPLYSGWTSHSIKDRVTAKIKRSIFGSNGLKKYDYDLIWGKILSNATKHSKDNIFHSGFVSYDDTPRRGEKGIVVINSNPEKFKSYLDKLVQISEQQGKDYVFLTAWNEWGEGAYLEPDTTNRYDYLKAIKEIVCA